MSPKVIDKAKRKKEIALVALDLFAEKGFEAASISEVAKAAEIGKGTVYEYFSSKEELIMLAFMGWIDNMMGPELEEMMASIDDPEQRLRQCIQTMMTAFVEDDRTVKITLMMFQLMLKENEFLNKSDYFQRFMQSLRKLFADTVLEGISRGMFRPEAARDAEKIAINLFAYLDGIAFHYLVDKPHINLMDQVNFYLDQMMKDLRIYMS